jgi:hypothetical protein
LTAIDKNSPPKMKSKKLNNSIVYKELEDMVKNDEEINKHKLEIEKLKRDQQRRLEMYMKKEIGRLLCHSPSHFLYRRGIQNR